MLKQVRAKRLLFSLMTLLLFLWVLPFSKSATEPFFLIASFVSVGVTFYCIFIARRALRYLRLETSNVNIWSFFVIVIVPATILTLEWPGFVSIDDWNLTSHAVSGVASNWHSLTYSFLTAASFLFWGKTPFLLSLFNLFLFANLVALLFSMKSWRWRSPIFWMLICLLLTPQTYLLILNQNRDSTYSLILLFFLFGFLSKSTFRERYFNVPDWELIVAGILLGDLRQEGLFITFLTPFLIYFFFGKQRLHLYRNIALTLVGGLFYMWLIPALLQIPRYSHLYQSTALINPLSYIVNVKGVDSLTADQKEGISGYFQLNFLVKYHTPYEIGPFHNGGKKASATLEDFRKFQRTTYELIFQNWRLFLENRLNISLRLFNLTGETFVYSDSIRGADLSTFKSQYGLININKNLNGTTFQNLHEKWIFFFFGNAPKLLRTFFGLIPLVTLLFLVCLFRRYPSFAVLAGVLLIRSLIFVVFTPAAQFKYITSTWLGGYLLLIFFLSLEKQKPAVLTTTP